jgi:hypothetical protein
MSASRFALAFCLLAGLAACKVTPAADESPPAGETEAVDSPSRAGEQPAVIVNPTPEGRAELEHVVSDMLFGAEVTLPMDALTKSSVLVLERERIKRLGQPPLLGRDLGRPERFRLLTTGSTCVLIHESNHARYELPQTDCVPENPE